HRHLFLVLRRRHDHGRFKLEFADELPLELDARSELGVERDADEAVAARVDEDAIDPKPRGAEAARDLRLREALHEIQPGGAYFGLVFLGHRPHRRPSEGSALAACRSLMPR